MKTKKNLSPVVKAPIERPISGSVANASVAGVEGSNYGGVDASFIPI